MAEEITPPEDVFKYGHMCGLLMWLEQQEGINLVSDDAGQWACTGNGVQDMPEPHPQSEGFTPIDMSITSFVYADEWCDTISEAIEKCRDA